MSKIRLIVIGLVIATILTIWITSSIRNRNEFRDLHIQGVITQIRISSNRGYPTFQINKVWQDLGIAGYSLTGMHGVAAGDSISKIKGEHFLLIYRLNSTGDYNFHSKVELD